MGHQLIARALRAQRRGDGREAAHGLESLLEVFVPQLIYQYLDGRQGILPLPRRRRSAHGDQTPTRTRPHRDRREPARARAGTRPRARRYAAPPRPHRPPPPQRHPERARGPHADAMASALATCAACTRPNARVHAHTRAQRAPALRSSRQGSPRQAHARRACGQARWRREVSAGRAQRTVPPRSASRATLRRPTSSPMSTSAIARRASKIQLCHPILSARSTGQILLSWRRLQREEGPGEGRGAGAARAHRLAMSMQARAGSRVRLARSACSRRHPAGARGCA
jgi:hypothetical protein